MASFEPMASMAFRTSEISTGFENLIWIRIPPAKSTPYFNPPNKKTEPKQVKRTMAEIQSVYFFFPIKSIWVPGRISSIKSLPRIPSAFFQKAEKRTLNTELLHSRPEGDKIEYQPGHVNRCKDIC